MTRQHYQQKLPTYSIAPSEFEQWIESNGGENNVITALVNTNVKELRKRSSQLNINIPKKPAAAAVVPNSTSMPPLSPPPSPLLTPTSPFLKIAPTTLIPAPAYHHPLSPTPTSSPTTSKTTASTTCSQPDTFSPSPSAPILPNPNTSTMARSHKKSKSWLSGLFSSTSSSSSSSCSSTNTATTCRNSRHTHRKTHSAPSFLFFGTKKRKHASSTTPPVPIPRKPSSKQSSSLPPPPHSSPPPIPPKHRPELNLPERYPSSIERVLYQMSCMKLMERRPLQQQVVVANLIYKYTTLLTEERESYFQRRQLQRQQQQQQRLREQGQQPHNEPGEVDKIVVVEGKKDEEETHNINHSDYLTIPTSTSTTSKINFLESCVIEGSRLELDDFYDHQDEEVDEDDDGDDDDEDEEEEDNHEEQRVVLIIKNL